MKSLRNSVVGIALVIATGTTLLAQPAPVPMPGEETSEAEKPASNERVLTLAEMKTQVVSLTDQVETDTKVVLDLQRRARKEQDIIKLNCINDVLVQLKAVRNIMDRSKVAFEVASNDGEHRTHFRTVNQNAVEVRQLRERANICAGEGELLSDSRASFQSPDIPDDPSEDLFPNEDYVEPPGYASPFN